MKAFEHLGSFGQQSSFATWIYRIAYNTALSFLRRNRQEEVLALDERQWENLSDTRIDEELNDDSEAQIQRLQQALTRLTAEERALVTLYYEEERPVSEIGQILNLSESNVKIKLFRIRKKLYVLLQNDDR
jgi:RNA polymerase sigma-70 factor (ECF subfamily)